MSTSYRTDWQASRSSDEVEVAYFDQDLSAARRKAREMSRRHGAAYVIARDDDTKCDLGQIAYYNGVADSRGFVE